MFDIEARIGRAREHASVRTIALNTSQHIRGFYERLGFRTVDVVPDGYAPGLDCCELRWALARGRLLHLPGVSGEVI